MWAVGNVRAVTLPQAASGVVLDLTALLALGVGERLSEVAMLVDDIRGIWNPAVAGAGGSTGLAGEIPESRAVDAPWLLFERGFFAAAEGLLSSKTRRQGHFHTSQGISVNHRAVRHLWENILECGKPHFGGGLTQELGYVCVTEAETEGKCRRALLLYDASAHAGTDFKGMRNAMVQVVRRTWSAGE
eukprot:gnl/TRDRNA2_/TRDRNA2_119206_c0_seq1.p1 gnl/TRDRNA2_/TRDRNA2_119206_c0~~gnl/TRDRNA2_/TRDRNA2_119206_c0_seq1.p1  ORF type:complete len:212 (-),score=29.99 gnl/TRDRNA2_/TRDRNA2_119206_c0_seq1:61-624(-)